MSNTDDNKKDRKTPVRFKENPFVKNLVITKKSKSVAVNQIGRENDVFISEKTGEVAGTEVRTWKTVDDASFIKLFSANISLTFDLTSPGVKALNVLIYAVQSQAINDDKVILDSETLEDFLKYTDKKCSSATFSRGINELIDAQIIARQRRGGHFFINPSFCFNGNRIVFTTVIERQNKGEEFNKYQLKKQEDQGGENE